VYELSIVAWPMSRPTTLETYKEWARNTLSADFDDEKSKNLYEVNLRAAFNTISGHEFFKQFESRLGEWNFEYENLWHSQLLMDLSAPELLIKPYESAIDKSFRANVLWNTRFPDPPLDGWVTPDNLFRYFNDGVRGTIVCKFIDGPSFATERLSQLAAQLHLENRWYSQEKDEGYYAYHFYAKFDVNFYDGHWKGQKSKIEMEIQVTTQLQEVLRGLTHHFYEQKRVQPDADTSKWKWEYKSNRFRASYLSHTLHLLEAVIVQSRDESMEPGRGPGKV